MELGYSNKVISRNSFGRFIAECEQAGRDTVRKSVQRGARISRTLAPMGHKHDNRTIPLKQSIEWEMTGATSGHWYATARHALPQEFGATPHVITGNPNLSFWWESAGKHFVPSSVYYNMPGAVTTVNHPGHGPQPYLRPAYVQVAAQIMQVAKQEYPG